MRGAHIVAACCLFVELCTVSTENTSLQPDDGAEASPEEVQSPQDHYTFVALLDIFFVDKSKKICTGTIIHDYVVLTAAHCFIKQSTKPELTLSFVVIGTKKMFDSGYEQYLPIEQYKVHPQFRNGWKDALAVVYTFAAMTSDKPGKALKLAGDRIIHPVDGSLIVLSWGQCGDEQHCNKVLTTRKPNNDFIYYTTTDIRNPYDEVEDRLYVTKMRRVPVRKSDYQSATSQRQVAINENVEDPPPDPAQAQIPSHKFTDLVLTSQQPPKTKQSRYISVTEEDIKDKAPIITQRLDPVTEEAKRDSKVKSYYANWRRKMGPQQNNLSVETFNFVNGPTCKKLLDQAAPGEFEIRDSNDFICFSSDNYYLSREDAGAPVVRQGRLLAVTLTGVESRDGQHVAVGLRIACFCSWIANNLPYGGSNIHCCKDCCNVGTTQESTLGRMKKYVYL